MNNKDAEYWIDLLNLQKHPEGGYYCETFRSPETLSQAALPERFKGDRQLYSSIFFLLKGEEISAFHYLHADEIWHFYEGSAIKTYTLDKNGTLLIRRLGRNPNLKESHQLLVENNKWFAAEMMDKSSFSLVGCTTSPGFDFDDFFMGDRKNLEKKFPEYRDLLVRLTY